MKYIPLFNVLKQNIEKDIQMKKIKKFKIIHFQNIIIISIKFYLRNRK